LSRRRRGAAALHACRRSTVNGSDAALL